jgi:hypothetical protein
MDARKCSPPWKGTLGSCTRGAEAGSKRSIANIARGGKMTPERKARQKRIQELKGKDRSLNISLADLDRSEKMLTQSARKLGIELPKIDPKEAMGTTLESLMGKAAATNKAFDKTAKKAKGIKDMSLEELFKEADRVGSKYQDKPNTMDEEFAAVKGARSAVNQALLEGEIQGRIGKLGAMGKAAKKEADARGKIKKLGDDGAKQVNRFKAAKDKLAKLKAENQKILDEGKADQTKKALQVPRKGRKQRARTQNAIRKFNRRADAMGWSTAVRMDAIALLLEVLN